VAEATGYSELVEMIYKLGKKWGMRDFWLETVGAQNILKFTWMSANAREKNPLYVNELPYDNSENAKVIASSAGAGVQELANLVSPLTKEIHRGIQ